MFSYFIYLLPVIWAITATVVALLLYRTSKAFFSETSNKEGTTRRIRLVGSVVIAAVVFIGLWRATPAREVGPEDMVLRKADRDRLNGTLADYGSAADRLDACLAIAAVRDCANELSELRAAAGQVRGAVTRAEAAGGGS